IVASVLGDDHAQVRRHAVILAERYPGLLSAVVALAEDQEAEVAFQVALSLGEFGERREVVETLAKLAATYGEDEWFRKAILSSDAGASYALYNQLKQGGFFGEGGTEKAKFIEELAFAVGARGNTADYKRLFSSFP